LLLGTFAVLTALGWLTNLVKTEPAVGFPVLLLLAGGVAYTIRAHKARKEHRRAVEAQRARVAEKQSREIVRYHSMKPKEFEQAIAYLCQRDGCTNTQVVGGAGDLGADVITTTPTGRRLVIQCKRYGPTHKVGSPDMQRFGGTCFTVHHAHIAAVVTTSTFTRQAVSYATAQGISLYDEQSLAAWATQTGPAPWHQPPGFEPAA
jgi:restriction system protein